MATATVTDILNGDAPDPFPDGPEIHPLEPAGDLSDLPLGALFKPWGFELPDDLSFEQWEQAGQSLILTMAGWRWWVGDWSLYGEKEWGESSYQAIPPDVAAVIDTIENLANYRWVASCYPHDKRWHDRLTWTHHRIAAALPTSKDRQNHLRIAWNDGARLPTAKFQEIVNERKAELDGDPVASPTSTHGIEIFFSGPAGDADALDDIGERCEDWLTEQLAAAHILQPHIRRSTH